MGRGWAGVGLGWVLGGLWMLSLRGRGRAEREETRRRGGGGAGGRVDEGLEVRSCSQSASFALENFTIYQGNGFKALPEPDIKTIILF